MARTLDRSKKPAPKGKRRAPQKVAQDHRIDVRIAEAFAMFKEGKSQRAIAQKLGVSQETIRQDLKIALAEIAKDFAHDLQEWKALQLTRLTELFEKWSKSKSNGVEAGRLVLSVLKELNEITGVRAPKRLDVSVGFDWSEIAKEAGETRNATNAD
jgi:DNA-binding CsgD family transcriptional regulator